MGRSAVLHRDFTHRRRSGYGRKTAYLLRYVGATPPIILDPSDYERLVPDWVGAPLTAPSVAIAIQAAVRRDYCGALRDLAGRYALR